MICEVELPALLCCRRQFGRQPAQKENPVCVIVGFIILNLLLSLIKHFISVSLGFLKMFVQVLLYLYHSHLGLEKCVVLNPHSASSYDHVAVPDDSEVDEVDQLDSASVDSGARRVLHDPRALPECFNIESDLHTLLRSNTRILYIHYVCL